MAGQPTNAEIMHAIREIHGDVKVALDRTATHEKEISHVKSHVRDHCLEISKAKGSATVFGALASGAVVAVVEIGKSMLGVKS